MDRFKNSIPSPDSLAPESGIKSNMDIEAKQAAKESSIGLSMDELNAGGVSKQYTEYGFGGEMGEVAGRIPTKRI